MKSIHAVLFHPAFWAGEPPSQDQTASLLVFGYIHQAFVRYLPVNHGPMKAAVITYGPGAIVKRFSELFQNDACMKGIAPHLVSASFRSFLPIPAVSMSCLATGTATTLVRRSWSNLKSEGLQTLFGPGHCLSIMQRCGSRLPPVL